MRSANPKRRRTLRGLVILRGGNPKRPVTLRGQSLEVIELSNYVIILYPWGWVFTAGVITKRSPHVAYSSQ